MPFPNVPGHVPAGWNDPDAQLFARSPTPGSQTSGAGSNRGSGAVDALSAVVLSGDQIIAQVQEILAYCKQRVDQNNSMQSKMLDDTDKKLSTQLRVESLNGDQDSCRLLSEYLQHLQGCNYVEAQKVVSQLMRQKYSSDSASNQWVLALKRLTDLHKNCSQS
ncbi:hypothetical protein MP228_005585 [Amoeboaphelidium protococcarum]|nr:hypothetical protein MP228_005585 [Amoeboaphelidium protococcarum]